MMELRGHPGAGGGHLESRKAFFPGRPSASRRRPFCLAANFPPKSVRGAFAGQGTPFTAGELRRSDELLGARPPHQPRAGKTDKEQQRGQPDQRRSHHDHLVPLESISSDVGISSFSQPDCERLVADGVGNWSSTPSPGSIPLAVASGVRLRGLPL